MKKSQLRKIIRESLKELINEQSSNSYPVNGAAAYVRSCAIGGSSFNTNFLVDGAAPQGGQIFQHGGYAGNDKVFVSSNDGSAYNLQNHVYGNGGIIDNPSFPCPTWNGQCNGNWPHWPIQSKTSLTPPPGVSMQQFCPNICTPEGESQGYGPNSAACQTGPTGPTSCPGCNSGQHVWNNMQNWITQFGNNMTNAPWFNNAGQPCQFLASRITYWQSIQSGISNCNKQHNILTCKIKHVQAVLQPQYNC
tara:strand:+ start:288 stop:1034 length:747 start_codon:yes stop_codon:yes gene_type:complete